MSVGRLFLEAFRALVRPHEAFLRIPHAARLNAWLVVPLLLLWGAVYGVLHIRILAGFWVPLWPPNRYVAVFSLLSLGVWLLGALGPAWLAKISRRPVSFARLEVAAFYLWAVFALMPLVDSVHLLGVPQRNFAIAVPYVGHLEFNAHASWFFTFPLLWLQLGFLLSRGMGWPRVRAFGVAAALLVGARVGFEPMPLWIREFLIRAGRTAELWELNAAFAVAMLGCCVVLRGWLAGRGRWLNVSLGSVMATIGAVILLW